MIGGLFIMAALWGAYFLLSDDSHAFNGPGVEMAGSEAGNPARLGESNARIGTVGTSEGIEFSIIDRESRSPVSGAGIVVCFAAGMKIQTGETNKQGSFATGCGFPCIIYISKSGYVDVLLQSGTAGRVEIELERASSLTIQFSSDNGSPFKGAVAQVHDADESTESAGDLFEVFKSQKDPIETACSRLSESRHLGTTIFSQLLDPSARFVNERQNETDAGAFKRYRSGVGIITSDEQGQARFEKLPSRRKLRWRAVSPLGVDVEPPFEVGKYKKSPTGGIAIGSSPPVGLSGPFELSPGEILQLSAVVHSSSIVKGRFVDRGGSPGKGCTFQILQRMDVPVEGAPGKMFSSLEHPILSRADDSGYFETKGLRPGNFEMQGRWRRDEKDQYFVSKKFSIEKGNTLDLGNIVAMSGVDVELSFELRAPGGEVVPWPEFFTTGDNEEINVTVDSNPSRSRENVLFFEFANAIPTRGLTLHGLPESIYSINASIGLMKLKKDGVGLLASSVTGTVDTRKERSCTIAFQLVQSTPIVLTLEVPPPDTTGGVAIFAWNRDTHELHSLGAGSSGGPQLTMNMQLSSGSYRFFATTATGVGDSPSNLYGESLVNIGPDSRSVKIVALPGAIVRGFSKRRDGTAHGDSFIGALFNDPEFNRLDKNVFAAVTNPDGSFIMRGLPPQTSLRISNNFGIIQTGAPGSESVVNLEGK